MIRQMLGNIFDRMKLPITAFDIATFDAMIFGVMLFGLLDAGHFHGAFITLHIEEFPLIFLTSQVHRMRFI